jgi:hypothetical protein
MDTKGIDVYAIQETWLPDNFTTVINGYYILQHRGIRLNWRREEEQTPTPQSGRGHSTKEVMWYYFYHPRPAQQHEIKQDSTNRQWRADQYLDFPDSLPPLYILLTTLET